MPHYQLVDQPDTLAPALALQEHLGVDTEFMREKTYYAQLCLLQIATPDEIYCVDPLTGSGQEAFWQKLLERDWVVHSARQDIEVIYQAAGTMPSSLFDTQIAAALLGYSAQMGYAGLVNELFGVEMAKSHTRADWTRRPLREAYLQYAAEDVEHLLPAYDTLGEKLEREGRFAWAREDSQALLDARLYEIDAAAAVDRLKGARNFRGRRRAAAARLAAWREKEAIKRDRPRQWIARDNVLLEIAYHLPGSRKELERLDEIPPKLVSRVGNRLLEEVAASTRDDNAYSPPRPPSESQKALLREMQAEVSRVAEELGIAAETVASKRELSAIIISGNRDSRVFSGWRKNLVGEALQRLL